MLSDKPCQSAGRGARCPAARRPSLVLRLLLDVAQVGLLMKSCSSLRSSLLAPRYRARPIWTSTYAHPARRSRILFPSAVILLASGVAWADGGDQMAARAQLRQGYALKQQGKCKEAVPYLEESARLDRQPKTLLNLGDCEQSLGHLAAAQAH